MKRHILNTRPSGQAKALSREIRSLGSEVVEFPVYEIKPPETLDQVRLELATYRSGDWFVFTSANGVIGLSNCLDSVEEGDRFSREDVNTAVVGDKTAEVARRYGFCPSVVPNVATGQQLVTDLLDKLTGQVEQPNKVFLWRTTGAVPEVSERLEAGGLQVSDVEVYRSVRSHYTTGEVTVCLESFLKRDSSETVICFTSGRGVEFFVDLVSEHASILLPTLLKRPVVVLGEGTHTRAVELGFKAVKLAPDNTIEALAKCAVTFDHENFS